jgi:vesicle-associated membrane protein 7
MCMCDDKLTQDSAFAYLEDLKSSFLQTFNTREIESAYAYSLNEKFKDNIRGKMNYYNANLNESDSVSKLKKGVMDYKDNILQANDILMERGEKINLIVRKADNLRTESMNYYGSVIKSFYKFRQKK